jgi:hypothetical protein
MDDLVRQDVFEAEPDQISHANDGVLEVIGYLPLRSADLQHDSRTFRGKAFKQIARQSK